MISCNGASDPEPDPPPLARCTYHLGGDAGLRGDGRAASADRRSDPLRAKSLQQFLAQPPSAWPCGDSFASCGKGHSISSSICRGSSAAAGLHGKAAREFVSALPTPASLQRSSIRIGSSRRGRIMRSNDISASHERWDAASSRCNSSLPSTIWIALPPACCCPIARMWSSYRGQIGRPNNGRRSDSPRWSSRFASDSV